MKRRFFLLIGLCCWGLLTAVGHYDSAFAAQTFNVTEPAKGKPDNTWLSRATVTFDTMPVKMHFRPPGQVWLESEDGFQAANGFAETKDPNICPSSEQKCDVEATMGGLLLNAKWWIARKSPARIVVRYRDALTDAEGNIGHTDIPSGSPYGRGDWVDEWHYIYPDTTHTRVVKIYTGKAPIAINGWSHDGCWFSWDNPDNTECWPFETQETFFAGPAGTMPIDYINVRAVTVINMKGQARRPSWKPYPNNASMLSKGNIQVVNLKARYKPFTIAWSDKDIEIVPYTTSADRDDLSRLKHTVFVTWPRQRSFPKTSYVGALTHIYNWKWYRQTKNTVTQLYLSGMTTARNAPQQAKQLVPVARSWIHPPVLSCKRGCRSRGFSKIQKAYVVKKTGSSILFKIAASKSSPLVNPAFVIQGWGKGKARIRLNGKVKIEGKKLRIGYENRGKTTDLVVWMEQHSTSSVRVALTRR